MVGQCVPQLPRTPSFFVYPVRPHQHPSASERRPPRNAKPLAVLSVLSLPSIGDHTPSYSEFSEPTFFFATVNTRDHIREKRGSDFDT